MNTVSSSCKDIYSLPYTGGNWMCSISHCPEHPSGTVILCGSSSRISVLSAVVPLAVILDFFRLYIQEGAVDLCAFNHTTNRLLAPVTGEK